MKEKRVIEEGEEEESKKRIAEDQDREGEEEY